MNILVCDDDREIAKAVGIYLEKEGYNVIMAYDGQEALKAYRKNDIHLILMDIMMPKLDGIKATMKIREEKNIPIIMLSAKSEDYDKIMGLNVGADDYMTKPFNPLELVARVKSQLRRYVHLGTLRQEKTEGRKIYKNGGIIIYDDEKKIIANGEEISLTPIEYGILRLLLTEPGKVFSMEEIYESVWGEKLFNSENTIAVHIRRIREKIEIDPKEPRYLKVVWGIGYKIEKF